jgi:hypothetical protein
MKVYTMFDSKSRLAHHREEADSPEILPKAIPAQKPPRAPAPHIDAESANRQGRWSAQEAKDISR